MKKLLFLSLVSSLLFVSCNDDEGDVFGPNSTIVGFASKTMTKNYVNDQPDADLVVPFGLVGVANDQATTQDIEVSWQVVESTAANAAVPGVDYDMPVGNGGTVTLLAGETSSVLLPINVHPTAFDPANPKKLTLRMVSATNAIVGIPYHEIVITLQGVCASNLQGEYLISNNPALGATVTALGNGVYKNSRLPNLTAGGNPIEYRFSEVCGQILIDCPVLGGAYWAQGSGVVNPDGSFTVSYILYSGGSPDGDVLFDFSTTPRTYYPL